MGFLLYTLLIILRAETITTMTTQPPSSPNGVVIHVTITQSYGTCIAGENYGLECSVSVTGSIAAEAQSILITWLDDAGTSEINSPSVTTGMVTSSSAGSYSSTLTFNPLTTSHAGTYTCGAILGDAEDTASKNVTMQSTCSKTPCCDVNILALLLLCLCKA